MCQNCTQHDSGFNHWDSFYSTLTQCRAISMISATPGMLSCSGSHLKVICLVEITTETKSKFPCWKANRCPKKMQFLLSAQYKQVAGIIARLMLHALTHKKITVWYASYLPQQKMFFSWHYRSTFYIMLHETYWNHTPQWVILWHNRDQLEMNLYDLNDVL